MSIFCFESVAETLADVWREGDWFKLDEKVKNHYFSKASFVAELQPKQIIEIGTRCGYSIAVFSLASPKSRFLCIDGALDDDSKECIEHWQNIVRKKSIDAQLVVVDSHKVQRLPPADFAHVDGDHSYGGALQDLRLVAHVPTILADDCDNSNVLAAVNDFVKESGRSVRFIDDGLRKQGIIT